MKKLLFFFIFCLFFPIVFSLNNQLFVGDNYTIVSNHILGQSGYYNNVSAYITVIFPNGTSDILNELATPSSIENGVFLYNYTLKTTGLHYTTTTFYNATDFIGTGSSTFMVEVNENMYLTIIIGIIFTIIFLASSGVYLMTRKNQISLDGISSKLEWFKIGDIGFMMIMLCFPLISLMIGFMLNISLGEVYYSLLQTVYQISIVLNIIVVGLFTLFYLMLRKMLYSIELARVQNKI